MYSYIAPTEEQINEYWKLSAQRHPATRMLSEADIKFGTENEFGWCHKDAFDAMIADLQVTPADCTPLWLRDGEVFLRTYGRTPERHCQWGRYSGELCRLPVVQVRMTWGLEEWGGPESQYYVYNQSYWIDSWRHLDGSPLHKREDDPYGPDCNACNPIPMCLKCGQEFLDNHCSQCHVNGALKTDMQAYGNDTRCTTPGCDFRDWYSIGD